MNVFKKLSVLFMIFFCLFLSVQSPISAKQAIKVNVDEGINGKVREGRGFPLTITVTNTGEDFSGDLVFDFSPSYNIGGARTIHIDIPEGETKEYSLSLPGFSDNLQHNMNLQTIHLFQDSWKTGKEINFTGDKRLNPNYIYADQHTIGFLSEQPDRLKELKLLKAGNSGRTETLELNKDTVPVDAIGLQIFDYIVIDEFNISSLKDRQQQAITEWVSNGGILIVGGSPDSSTSLGQITNIVPMKQLTEGKLSNSKLFKVNNGSEVTFSTLPLFYGEVTDSAEVVVSHESIPVIVSKAYGHGEVWQTAFSLGDAPLSDWEGYSEWFNWLLLKTEPYYMNQTRGYQSYLEPLYYEFAEMNELFPTSQFSISTLVIILVIYLILIVPILYLVLRKFDKREQAWWIIPGLAILVSIGIFTTGAKDRIASPQLNQFSVLEVDDNKNAKGITAATLLSNTSGNYEVIADRNQTDLYPSLPRVNQPQQDYYQYIVEAVDAEEQSLTFRDVEYWSTRTLFGRTNLKDIGSFDTNLTFENEVLKGTITNNFQYDFSDIFIWSGTRTYRLGELPKGESIDIEQKLASSYLTSPSGSVSGVHHIPNQNVDIAIQKRDRLQENAYQMIVNGKQKSLPVLFGYTADSIVPVDIKGKEEKRNSLALIYQPVTATNNYSGEFTLRNDQLRLDVQSLTGQLIEKFQPYHMEEMALENGTYEMTLSLPDQMNMEKTLLTSLSMQVYTPEALSFSIVNTTTGEKVPFKEGTNAIQMKEELQNFVSSEGVITFHFEKQSKGSSQDPFVRIPGIVLKGEVRK